jgi:ketosteroid isomerase-like protein
MFKSGDIETLLNMCSEDITWRLPELENSTFGGKRIGRKGVIEFFSLLDDAQENLQFEPQEFIAQGDKVVVLGRYSYRIKATGKKFDTDFVQVMTIKDGKLTGFQEYMDTAAVNRAYLQT